MVGKFLASHCELHSVGFFLLGSDVAYYAAVGYLALLGNLVLVGEETCVYYLNILYSLE